MRWTADTDLDKVAPQHKQVGSDWYAVFNPHIPRHLDIDLLYAIPHEAVVCCARFSPDGHYLATASHQSVQVFEAATGRKVATLFEPHGSPDECFIRSICFSPDGQYLATASEDKIIRVSICLVPLL